MARVGLEAGRLHRIGLICASGAGRLGGLAGRLTDVVAGVEEARRHSDASEEPGFGVVGAGRAGRLGSGRG